ncbi:hypothetical protein BJ165DRAFT_131931 [Panaeolus papilionaceus]|nr:hypothetical protein BJ165DRAFT_131931 [Panaeolus papilionaceus]
MSFKKKKPSHYETCTPTIPSEIFGLIIADIASEGDTTLKDLQAVSLVCRHFLVLCTPHLFAHLRIKVSSSGIQYIRHLFQLLDANPSLAKHTTKLTVICEARHTLVVDSTSKDSIVISIEPLIKRFLSLPKIDSLSIQGSPLPMMLGEDPWYIMSPPHGSGYPLFLDRYTTTNHITTLSLTGIMEVPYLNVLLIPNLIFLELKHCCGELSLAEAPASRELALEIKKGKSVSSIKHFFAENVQIISPIHIARFLPNVETMYLKEIKWDVLAGFWDMDDEWIDLVMLSGSQPRWLTYPNLRKLTSMGAVSLQVFGNQRSGIKQLPALKELELQQQKDWDVECSERIYRHLTCLEVLKIRGEIIAYASVLQA